MPELETDDGVTLRYTDQGDGPALVLIHGWTCTGAFFKRNVDALADRHRVINLDLRGHGQSDKPAHGHHLARYAKDLHGLLGALALPAPAVLGWSMGSSVIWSYLELFGAERLGGVILVDQSPRMFYAPDWNMGCKTIYDAETLTTVLTALQHDPEAVARGLVGMCSYQPVTQDEEDFFAAEIANCPPAIRTAIMVDHAHADWRSVLPQAAVPALVVVGRRSAIFPWESCAYVGEQIPNARTVFFEESGHMPFYEEPDRFNQVVSEWVTALRGTPTKVAAG